MALKSKIAVKAGDTYSTIAKQMGVPEEVLKAANKGVATVKPGQVINTGLKGGITTGAGTSSGQQVISTGANKDIVTLPNGNRIQMAPNTTVTIPGQAPNVLQQIQSGVKNAIGVLTGTTSTNNTPGGAGTIRGNKVPGLASPAQNVFAGVNSGGGTVVQNTGNGNIRSRQNPTGVQYTGNPGSMQFGTAGMYNYNQANYDPLGTKPAPYTGTAGYYGQSSRQYLESQQANPQQNFQTPATNGFSGQNQNGTPIQQPGKKNPSNPNSQAATNQASAQVNAAVRPNVPYTGNPNDPATAQWKAYWNQSATAGRDIAATGQAAPPPVMTRAQIWEMKAAQRRRQMEKGGVQVSYNQAGFTPTDPNQTYTYPDNVRTIIWGA